MKTFLFVLTVALGATAGVRAQHATHTIPVVPNELLERATTIRAGIGTAHDPIDTKAELAQRFYNQGLAYLHSYVWIEAARSFNQALRLDPSLVIAHASLSLALVELNQSSAASAALARAQAGASKASPHDRRHIELRVLQADAEANAADKTRLAAYRQALDSAIKAFPEDVEFLLQRGVAEASDPTDRGQGAGAAAIPYYERALAASPDDFTANHYLTHAYENSGRQDAALKAAAEYAKAAGNVPHARHMLGHSLRRAGRPVQALAEFVEADRSHRDYFKRENVPAQFDWHFHHNLDLMASTRQYLGQMKQAAALLKESFDLPSNLVVQVYNKREWPSFLRGRGRLQDALAATKGLIGHPHPTAQAAGYIEAGFAQVAAGQWGDGATAFNTALKILRSGAEAGTLAAPALLTLQGEIALRTADREKGRRVLLESATRWRALPGPDGWVQALFALEAMARTARQVGDWELAALLAQQMMAHDPSYAGSHYATGLVAERNGDVKTASAEFALAQKYWSQADPDLPELIEIRKKVK